MEKIVNETVEYVKSQLSEAEGGHDWWHTYRVWRNAIKIASSEDVDLKVVELSALLHDIADSKFHDGDEEIGPATAQSYLESKGVENNITDHVVSIIRNMSFKTSLEGVSFTSPEMLVVQDADRLDAIGAVGIARAFSYGGFKNRLLFNPNVLPDLQMTKEQYKKSTAPTINHFYEKLLLLKDKMNTKTGRLLAEKRHQFMIHYLAEFYEEVDIVNWPPSY